MRRLNGLEANQQVSVAGRSAPDDGVRLRAPGRQHGVVWSDRRRAGVAARYHEARIGAERGHYQEMSRAELPSKARGRQWIFVVDLSVFIARRSLSDRRAHRANDLIDFEILWMYRQLVEAALVPLDFLRVERCRTRAPGNDHDSRACRIFDEKANALGSDEPCCSDDEHRPHCFRQTASLSRTSTVITSGVPRPKLRSVAARRNGVNAVRDDASATIEASPRQKFLICPVAR